MYSRFPRRNLWYKWHEAHTLAHTVCHINGLKRCVMMTSSKNFPRYWPLVRGIHRSPVNFPHKGQLRRGFDAFFDLRLNQQLSKKWRLRCFETPSRSLWRHCNGNSSGLAVASRLVCIKPSVKQMHRIFPVPLFCAGGIVILVVSWFIYPCQSCFDGAKQPHTFAWATSCTVLIHMEYIYV